MWYTPLGSRPASAECSQTYIKLVQGERNEQVVNEWQGCLLALLALFALFGVQLARHTPNRRLTSITGGKRVVRLPFCPFSLFGRTACERRRVRALSDTGREA